MKKSSKDIALGMTFEDDFEIADAIKHYSLALKNDPSNIVALRGKARCLIVYIDEPKKLEEGHNIVNNLITIHGVEEFPVYLLKAKFLWRLRQYQKALHWIDLAKNEFGENDNPELLFTEARILATNEMKMWKKAEMIAKRLPSEYSHFIRGRISFVKENFKDALTHFEKSFSKGFKINDDSAVDNYLICASKIRPENFGNRMNYEKNKAAFEDALSIGQKFLESHGKSIISWKLILSIRSLFMTEIRLFYRNNMYYEISEDSLTGDWEHTKQKSVGKVSKLMLSLEKKMIRFVENIQHNQNEFFQADQKEKEKHTMRVLLSDKLVAYQSHKEYDQALVALDEYYSFCDKDNEFTTMYYNFNKARIFHSMKNWKQALLFFKKLKITSKNNPVLKNSQTPLQTELFTLTAMIDCYDMLKDKKNHLRYLKIYNKRKKFLTPAKVRKESLDIGNSKLHKSKSKEVIKIKHPGEEGQRLEFKSSFFIHGNTVKRNNRIVRIVNHRQRVSEEKKGQEDIAATVCSFLNSDGGDVYIGVDDKTKICYGLEREFTRTNNSTDTYTQTVRQTIQSKFREHYTTELTFDFYKHRDPDTNEPIQLYQIHVEPLLDTEKKPCSVKHSEGNEVVYFREGDSDKRFDLMDGTVEWYKRIEINRNRV